MAFILVQVAAVGWVMRTAGIDPLALRRVVYLSAVGFVVNHLLPMRYRMAFFALFSVAGMIVLLGGTVDARFPDLALGLQRTGLIALVGTILVGICHLPIGFWTRAALLTAIGGGIAFYRADVWGSGALAVVWPVLASMFMFRLMVYLYDVSTAREKPQLSAAVGYFGLLPNVCTPLFPVIDYRTFVQKHYDEPALEIYQRGVSWMARGVMQLLLYRLVDRILAIDPASVASGEDVIRYVATNVFLYLKISGGFHLVVGMLLLFGFNLSETNHRYFLASSFTDYWRRVNIYWRNFIMKVVYYPAFFRLKHLGQVKALAAATVWAFFITWAFHLYQTWWIKGSVAWSWPDTLFWATLGVLVLLNSLWELRHNRQRRLSGGRLAWGAVAGVLARTAGTFAVIAMLWSLWSAPTLADWLRMWAKADWATAGWGAVVLVGVMLAALICEVRPMLRRQSTLAVGAGSARDNVVFGRPAVSTAALLGFLCVATAPFTQTTLEGSRSRFVHDVGAILRVVSDKEAASQGQSRGYYENLTSPDHAGGQFQETMNPGRRRRYTQPTQPVDGVVFGELTPNIQFQHHDWKFETNRWGMRDRDYELAKPADCVRLAVLGSSHVMGFGLPDGDLFETKIEERLAREHGQKARFEVLNFGVGGLSPLGQEWLLRERAARFNPDMVVFVAHANDFDWTLRDLMRVVRRRLPLPHEFPTTLLEKAGVDADTPEGFGIARLRAYESEVLGYCYRRVVEQCRSMAATPVYIYLPVPIPWDESQTSRLLRIATDAGFHVVDLSNVYAGHDLNSMVLNDEGRHLNAVANQLVADAVYKRLMSDAAINPVALVRTAGTRSEPRQ